MYQPSTARQRDQLRGVRSVVGEREGERDACDDEEDVGNELVGDESWYNSGWSTTNWTVSGENSPDPGEIISICSN